MSKSKNLSQNQVNHRHRYAFHVAGAFVDRNIGTIDTVDEWKPAICGLADQYYLPSSKRDELSGRMIDNGRLDGSSFWRIVQDTVKKRAIGEKGNKAVETFFKHGTATIDPKHVADCKATYEEGLNSDNAAVQVVAGSLTATVDRPQGMVYLPKPGPSNMVAPESPSPRSGKAGIGLNQSRTQTAKRRSPPANDRNVRRKIHGYQLRPMASVGSLQLARNPGEPGTKSGSPMPPLLTVQSLDHVDDQADIAVPPDNELQGPLDFGSEARRVTQLLARPQLVSASRIARYTRASSYAIRSAVHELYDAALLSGYEQAQMCQSPNEYLGQLYAALFGGSRANTGRGDALIGATNSLDSTMALVGGALHAWVFSSIHAWERDVVHFANPLQEACAGRVLIGLGSSLEQFAREVGLQALQDPNFEQHHVVPDAQRLVDHLIQALQQLLASQHSERPRYFGRCVPEAIRQRFVSIFEQALLLKRDFRAAEQEIRYCWPNRGALFDASTMATSDTDEDPRVPGCQAPGDQRVQLTFSSCISVRVATGKYAVAAKALVQLDDQTGTVRTVANND